MRRCGILARAVKACLTLTGGKGVQALDVIRHGVALQQAPEGGVTRQEKAREFG